MTATATAATTDLQTLDMAEIELAISGATSKCVACHGTYKAVEVEAD